MTASAVRKKRTHRVMGTVDQLPAEFRDQIHALLQSGWSQVDIVEAINSELRSTGGKPISRQALNRYTKRVTLNAGRIREAREAAAAWSQTIGKMPAGDIGACLLELVQVLAFEHLHSVVDSDDAPDTKHITDLALAVRRLEEANATVEHRIDRARQSAAQAAAQALNREGGISQATIEEVRRRILGAA